MGGRHRKRVPVTRRLAMYGLCMSAIITLVIAFLSQPVPVSSSAETLDPPRIDVFTSDSQPTPTPSPTAKTKIKRSQRAARQALSSPLPKIEKDQAVTPADPPSIKVEERTAASSQQDHPRTTTPRAARPTKITKPPVVQRQVIPKSIIPKEESRPTTKSAKPSARITTTPRVVPSTPLRTTPTQKPKPPAIPTVPTLTTNSKCANIGLLPQPKAACSLILAAFPEVKSILGVGSRAGNPNSCHPKGLALDLIVGTNKALGDRLYAYVIARRSALGATPVVLWQVADHFDHVHISFAPCKG